MAQNINIIQSVLMPPGGPLLAPAGQTYQLPANPLIGEISFRRSDKRKITEHMRSMGIVVGLQGDSIYGAWRDAVKDQMLARGYQTDLHPFREAEFLQIVAGFRQLRPACDDLATVSVAKDIPGMQEVDEAVVQLVKDSGKKLTNTINLKSKLFPQVPGVPPAQVIVLNILLPANAPPRSQWGLATPVQNAGAEAPNAPTANAPGPAQFQPAQAAGLYQIPPPSRIPKGQYNFLCQRLEILVRQEALDRICLPWQCALSNCACARLLAHSQYQVLHRRITHNKCFLRSW